MKISFSLLHQEPQRLDTALFILLNKTFLFKHISRSAIAQLIKQGNVKVNNKIILKPSYIVFDRVEIILNYEEKKLPYLYSTSIDIAIDILYEDEDIIVINKPADLVVHPGAGNPDNTLLDILYRAGKFLDFSEYNYRLGIVHRLDKDTSGLLVVAKNQKAHNFLSKQFQDKTAKREYIALVLTTPKRKGFINMENTSGIIDLPLARDKNNKIKMAVDNNGKKAITHWKVLAWYNYGILLQITLQTGRTHQIRAHLSHIGHPIIGDKIYGVFSALPSGLYQKHLALKRQALHACKLQFLHPKSGKEMFFYVDPPKDIKEIQKVFAEYGI